MGSRFTFELVLILKCPVELITIHSLNRRTANNKEVDDSSIGRPERIARWSQVIGWRGVTPRNTSLLQDNEPRLNLTLTFLNHKATLRRRIVLGSIIGDSPRQQPVALDITVVSGRFEERVYRSIEL